MPISIFEDIEKKNIPEWREIFIGQEFPDEKAIQIPLQTPSLQTSPAQIQAEIAEIPLNIQKIKNQILKNISLENSFKFDPCHFLISDLFGRIFLKKNPDKNFWVKDQDSVSERESELMKFLFEELYLSAKNYRGNLDEETVEMVLSILASEGRIPELIEFHASHFQNKVVSGKLKALLYLIGENDDMNPESIESETILSMLCKYKKSTLNYSEEDALYDIIIAREYPGLTGVVYSLFSKRISGLRNAFPLFQIVLKNFDLLTIEEKKLFIDDFLRTNFFYKAYFLMKKVYSKEEIKKWLQNLIDSSGKHNRIGLFEQKSEKISLSKKYEMLKNQGLLYTLSPFEILTLLNSQVGENVKDDIFSAESRLPGSYLIQRSCSVVYFFEEDYESFFHAQSKSGRLRFGTESLYLKAIALKESGLIDEGNDILVALEKKFPESNLLKSSMENHRI